MDNIDLDQILCNLASFQLLFLTSKLDRHEMCVVLSRSMAKTRLQQLTQQLYGKEESVKDYDYSVDLGSISVKDTQPKTADTSYLTRDLTKILLVASLLVAIQIVVKFAFKI